VDHAACLGQPLPHRRENQPVIAPKALPAAHRLQEKNWQQNALGESPAARMEADFTAAVGTMELGKLPKP
jgi:hypothetical protein